MEFFSRFHQANDVGLLFLRIALGMIFWAHGRYKKGTWKMQPSEQMPAPFLAVVRTLSIAEPLGAIAVVLGLLTQAAAIGFCLVMFGALSSKKKQNIAFLAENTTGWELDLLVLASSVMLVVSGAGQYSLDRLFFGI